MVQQELSACMASLHPGSHSCNLPEFPFSFFYPCKSLLCHCVAIISLPLILRQFVSYIFELKWVASPGSPSAEQGIWILKEADGSFVCSFLKRSFLHLVLLTGTKWEDEISISGHQDSSQRWRNCLEEQQYCTEMVYGMVAGTSCLFLFGSAWEFTPLVHSAFLLHSGENACISPFQFWNICILYLVFKEKILVTPTSLLSW